MPVIHSLKRGRRQIFRGFMNGIGIMYVIPLHFWIYLYLTLLLAIHPAVPKMIRKLYSHIFTEENKLLIFIFFSLNYKKSFQLYSLSKNLTKYQNTLWNGALVVLRTFLYPFRVTLQNYLNWFQKTIKKKLESFVSFVQN